MDTKTITIGYDEIDGIYTLTNGTKLVEPREIGGPERVMRFSLISRQLRWLQGELLTILEATIDDNRKLEATKNLVKDKFNSKISWIYELCGAPVEEEKGLEEVE